MLKLKERTQRRKRYLTVEEQLLMTIGLIVFLFFLLVGIVFLGAWVQGL